MIKRLLQIAAVACVCGTAWCAELSAVIKDADGRPVPDAVVVAIPTDRPMTLPARRSAAIEDQVDKEFVPYVNPILVGTSVTFPNSDNVRHHVYSFSQAKRFELPLYAGTPAKPVVFDTAGVVVIGCNIHDWMVSYIYVSESPYFAKTGNGGAVKLDDLPPGSYQVRAWHPRMTAAEETTRRAVVLTNAKAGALEWQLALRPETRPRRAPVAGQRNRY
jgi:plastocyanin